MAAEATGDRPADVLALIRALNDLIIIAEPHIFRLYNETGLTVTQLRLLRLLREGPVPAGRLAELISVSPPSLTRMLNRMEDLGLVTRQLDSADRRRLGVGITDQGVELLRFHNVLKGSAFESAARAMTAAERRRATRLLTDLRDRVRGHADPIG